MLIHPTAQIDPSAILAPNVRVGAYVIIGQDVEIGSGTIIDSHAVINGPTKIGKNNHIYSFASVGGDPQDMSYEPEQDSSLLIGDDNHIREFSTINRGTEKQDAVTRVGSNNMIMAYVHIAHDCVVGNNTVLTNNTTLAGHVIVDDWAILGGFTLVKQFCHIGSHVYTGMGCKLNKDVPPFVIVSGQPAKVRCVNTLGLKRRGVPLSEIAIIKREFKKIFSCKGRVLTDAIDEITNDDEPSGGGVSGKFLKFIKESKNGILFRNNLFPID